MSQKDNNKSDNDNKPTILVVDPSKTNALLWEHHLFDILGSRCKFEIARNGADAIEMFDDNDQIKMVITELLLPKKTGIDVVKHIIDSGRRPFIIVASATLDVHQEDGSLDEIEGHIAKSYQYPLNIDIAVFKLEKKLRKMF